jgi:branched-chain amino acid transport system permease protein
VTQVIVFLVLGLGAGAIYAGVGLGVVLTYRSSGVLNLAYGAVAMVPAYIYASLRSSGALIVPIPGLPDRFQIASSTTGMGVAPSIAISLGFALALGVLMHYLVFRPLRHAPVVAKVVASVGVLITLQAVVLLRFGSDNPSVASVLPAAPVKVFGATVPRDRLYLAAIVIVVGVVLALVYRYTRFGLATRAAAENELSATLLGMSPDTLSAVNTIFASVLAGALGILVAPITALDSTTYTLLIIPALAAALLGRFTSFGVTVAAALGLGMLQSEILHLQTLWSWIPKVGTQDALPFVIIVIAMVLVGSKLPTRSSIVDRRLPLAVRSTHPWWTGGVVVVAAVVLAIGLPTAYRYTFVTTLVGVLICLSLVILTGFLGQISLAQMAFAGAAGFALPKIAQSWHLPFFVAAIPAVLIATVVGVIVGLPALRVRGVNLAVVTLALSVAVSAFVFANPKYTGGYNGIKVAEPNLFGLALGSGGDRKFAVMCLVLVVIAAAGVSWLRRSRLGLKMLAVRANERAATAAGIDVRRMKIIGFAMSAALAGVGGVLLAAQQVTVTFQSFDVFVSLGYLAVIFLGGVATVGGSVVGGVLASGGLGFYCLQQWIGLGRYELLISGVALVLTAVFAPQGLVGGFAQIRSRLPARSAGRPPRPGPGAIVLPADLADQPVRARGASPVEAS